MFSAPSGFFGATSCRLLRAGCESSFESFFESPAKANTDEIVGHRNEGSDGRRKVRVAPGSSRDEVVGWLADALKIKVSASPELTTSAQGAEKALKTAA